MEETKTSTGQNLGTAALITSIVAFVLALIPCVGIIAIIPGIIAIILASVGLTQASRSKAAKGTLTTSLILAILAIIVSLSWGAFIANKVAKNAGTWSGDIEKVVNEVQKSIESDLKNANISIKIENGNDTLEISTSVNKNDLEKTLEELEGGSSENDDTTIVISVRP